MCICVAVCKKGGSTRSITASATYILLTTLNERNSNYHTLQIIAPIYFSCRMKKKTAIFVYCIIHYDKKIVLFFLDISVS